MLCVLGEKCVGSVGSVISCLSSPCEFVVADVMCVSAMFVLHNSGRIKKGALEGGRSGYLWVKLRGDCGGQGGNGMGRHEEHGWPWHCCDGIMSEIILASN